MKRIYKGASVFSESGFSPCDIVTDGPTVTEILPASDGVTGIDLKGLFLLPGLIDVHVHFREPGFVYKENIATGTAAAAHGGFTYVCTMPNTEPPPCDYESLFVQLTAIGKDARVRVKPFGRITSLDGKGLSDMDALAPYVAGFSDDGKPVADSGLMQKAMEKAASLGKIISAHCEDTSLIPKGAYANDGVYAASVGVKGIPSESEWRMIKRDLELAEKTGCAYHVCHISTLRSVELIRRAKAKGIDVTCETAPHYLLCSDSDITDDGRYKMNPPLRTDIDRMALLEGIADGTIDMIATDHAPHSAEEKSGGMKDSLMGVVGLETAFPALFTALVGGGLIDFGRLMQLMHSNPARRFGIGTKLAVGEKADFTVFDLGKQYRINPDEFLSKGKSTPFAGFTVAGKCMLTVCGGEIAYKDTEKFGEELL